MSLDPQARHGAEALSSQAKRGVRPVPRPEKRAKSGRAISRGTELKRGSGPKASGPLGHASDEQKAKVDREGPRLDRSFAFVRELFGDQPLGITDPAHITPRPHGGCDSEHCVCPLPRLLHDLYDEGKLDLLPWLTEEEQAHAASHGGLLKALKRTTGERYVPATSPPESEGP